MGSDMIKYHKSPIITDMWITCLNSAFEGNIQFGDLQMKG